MFYENFNNTFCYGKIRNIRKKNIFLMRKFHRNLKKIVRKFGLIFYTQNDLQRTYGLRNDTEIKRWQL